MDCNDCKVTSCDLILHTELFSKCHIELFRKARELTVTDADHADDVAILANTPNQAETLLHNLERAAAGIGLNVNVPKTEYMYYNQTDGTPLKLVDKFTYLGSSVSSTEKDIDTRLTKA